LFSDSGPPLRPERSLRSPARLRTASPIGRPGQSTTSDSDPMSPTGVRQKPAHCSSPTSAIRADWDQLTRDARSVRTGKQTEKVRQGTQVNSNTEDRTLYTCRTVQTWHVRRYPATFQTCQNPSCVVGVDVLPNSVMGAINSHTRRTR